MRGFAIFAFLVFARTSGAGICPVVSEIQALPVAGGSEWIEISNLTETVVSLGDWSLGDGTTEVLLDSGAAVPADGQLVLAYDCTRLREQFGTASIRCVQPGRWSQLSTQSDRVVLRDAFGATCDSVEWSARTWGDWPTGRSMERVDLHRSGNDAANWTASSNPNGGTPGWLTNSVLEPIGAGISIEMVSRRAATGSRSAVVRLHAPWNARLEAGVWDLSRRRMATIFDGQIPASGELAWDGGVLRPGVYVMLLEFRTQGKDVAARFREWVVVEK
ncbi:MAG: hypothetical protein RL173_912 [Fibrobacterota bacterium]|jgi:hypothetical protein